MMLSIEHLENCGCGIVCQANKLVSVLFYSVLHSSMPKIKHAYIFAGLRLQAFL